MPEYRWGIFLAAREEGRTIPAADFFANGLKGRWREARDYDEHSALGQFKQVPHVQDIGGQTRLVDREVPLRNAMNEVLRESYASDCERVVRRWNDALGEEGVQERINLPSTRFFRRQGIYTDSHFDPRGDLISTEEWEARRDEWLPTADDRAWVESLMKPVHEPGKMANWIAAPRKGINGNPVEFEYVRTDG